MICFLDMDGVLVNWRRGVHQSFGIKYAYTTQIPECAFWKKWDSNISFEEVDSICTIDFWAGLRWMHDGKEILQLIENKFGPENIYLLSCPMPNPGSATGKMLWVERHLPEYKKRTIITQAPKVLFAAPDRVLVDDRNENIEKFAAAGGKYSLIARPWNFRYNCLTIPTLKKDLEGINVQSSCNS